jgi:hypothetical protein
MPKSLADFLLFAAAKRGSAIHWTSNVTIKAKSSKQAKSRLATPRINHFELRIPVISATSFQALVCGAGTTRPELACEENQRRADQASAAQQPEAIEGCQERSLLIQDPAKLRVRVD